MLTSGLNHLLQSSDTAGWANAELVIAACRDLVFAGLNQGYAILAHQTANTALPDIKADLSQFFGHPWPAVTAQTETRLFFDLANVAKPDRCLWQAAQPRNARKPRELTPTISHN